jgi:hypothetical protein
MNQSLAKVERLGGGAAIGALALDSWNPCQPRAAHIASRHRLATSTLWNSVEMVTLLDPPR